MQAVLIHILVMELRSHMHHCSCCWVSAMSNTLQVHGLHHARLPCPSLSLGTCSNSSPLSQWCNPTISSSVAPFSSCLQSFQASGSFITSWLFVSSGQSIGASVSVLLINIQDLFHLGLTSLIPLQSKGLSGVLSNTTVQKHQFFSVQPLWPNSHILTWLLEKPSVHFSHSVVCDSLPPHGLKHSRLPCPSPTPEACSNSCPLSRWCYLTISSSATRFSFALNHSLPSGFFSSVLALHIRLPEYWSFSINPFTEYSGLISFRIKWLDLLAAQGILKSLLQHHNLKASILGHSAFLMVQIIFVKYLTSGKTIVVIIRTCISKMMSLLSKFVIVFLPKSKHLLISCLQSLSTVTLEPKKSKSVTASTFPFQFAM